MPECLSSFLDGVPGAYPWARAVRQALVTEGLVETREMAKELGVRKKEKLAKAATDRLNMLTQRTEGFHFMKNGCDQKEAWQIKLFLNISAEPFAVHLTGPKGSRDEAVKVGINILPGHALASCAVTLPGRSRPVFPRGLVANPPRAGIAGLVLIGGLCDFRTVEMPAALPPPVPLPVPAQPAEAKAPEAVVVRGPRRRRCEELDALNEAFVDMEDDHYEHVKAILGLKGAEEQSAHAMTSTKRRKLKDIFELLAKSDEPLRKIARTAIGAEVEVEEDEDEDGEPATASASTSSQPSYARWGKCICGAKEVGGKEGKKVALIEKMGKGKKVPL